MNYNFDISLSHDFTIAAPSVLSSPEIPRSYALEDAMRTRHLSLSAPAHL